MRKNKDISGVVDVKRIKEFMKINKYSVKSFSKRCKIRPKELKRVLSDRKDFDIVLLFKIARVMQIEIHEIFFEMS